MSKVRSVHFSNLCRVCTSSSDHKVDVFSNESRNKNLCAKVNECLPLNMEETDRLPKMMCHQCVQNVESFIAFRNLCRNSQNKLNGWLNLATDKITLKESKPSNTLCDNNVLVSANQSAASCENFINNQPTTSTSTSAASASAQSMPLMIQGSSNVLPPITVTAVPPLASLGGGGNDLLNSILQTVTIQPQPTSQQHQQNQQLQEQPHNIETEKEKSLKNSTLEEFLKLKPNLKVTSVNKKSIQQQPQQQQPPPLQLQQQSQTTSSFPMQQHQQQQEHLQLQQLQQQLQMQLQQLQQQQLQQQLQLLTAQIQPQQITISTPNATLTPICTNTNNILNGSCNINANITDNGGGGSMTTSLTTTNNGNGNGNSIGGGGAHSGENDDSNTNSNRNSKGKINFVITSPNNGQVINGNGGNAQATHLTSIPSQIQLQLQTPQTQQQSMLQNNASATGALLSNLAPLLQQQTQGTALNAVFQNPAILQPTAPASTMLSTNKCYLPITIRDENSDQQFVAHIDAKNFLLPTTYQLQMKLQPQIATADGQPIMQLAPTSIPATLQINPQNLTTGGQGLTSATLASLGGNLMPSQITPPGQLISIQSNCQQQQPQQQQQQQQFLNVQSTASIQHEQMQMQMPIQIDQQQQQQAKYLNRNVPMPNFKEETKGVDGGVMAEVNNLNGGNKLKLLQTTITNSNEMTTGNNNFTHQIMQQIQQQQQQQHESFDNISTIQTQHGGVTVQRINKTQATTSSSTPTLANNLKQKLPTQLSAASVKGSQSAVNANITKLPIINKQNITISRITTNGGGGGGVRTVSPSTGKIQHHHQIESSQMTTTTGNRVTHTIAGGTDIIATNNNPTNNVMSTIVKKKQVPSNTSHRISQSFTTPSKDLQEINDGSAVKVKTCLPPGKVKQGSKAGGGTTTAELVNPGSQQSNKIIVLDNNKLEFAKPQKHMSMVVNKTSSNSDPDPPVKAIPKKLIIESNQKVVVANVDGGDDPPPVVTIASTPVIRKVLPISPGHPSTFQCVTCNRTFKRKELLTQHVKLHAGVRPFKCTEEGCEKAFSRKEHLHRHLISHTGKKLFNCDFCEKPFSRKDNLSKHRKTHTETGNTNTYNCQVCNKSFAIKSYFEQHKLKHEKMLAKSGTEKDCGEKNGMMVTTNTTTPTTISQQMIGHHDESQVRVVQQQQQQQQSQQIMHLQLPSSIVSSTTGNNLVGNTITITETYPSSNGVMSNNNNNNNIHDGTVLNLPTSLASFVQQAQIVDTTTGQIMGHVKIQK